MDSLPQEIIDEIIDNLPRNSLRSSSLVAKRWKKRSQQRALYEIWFSSELMVKRWHLDVQSDPGGISSYVQFAGFDSIKWNDPALFYRVLEGFSSLITLWTFETEIPEEMPKRLSHGELGRKITALQLRSPRCSLSTVISMSLSFPNLRKLWVDDEGKISREGPPAYPVLQQRGPLDCLYLSGLVDEVAEALANSRFTSRRLFLDFRIQKARDLLTLSSMIVRELMLIGMLSCVDRRSGGDNFADYPYREGPSHLADLPPFPALTSLKIYIFQESPSRQLIHALSSISSVPALASISIEIRCLVLPRSADSTIWEHLDRLLVQMAKNSTVEGGLVMTLTDWPYGDCAGVLFPEFGKAGKIKSDPKALDFFDDDLEALPFEGSNVSHISFTDIWLKEERRVNNRVPKPRRSSLDHSHCVHPEKTRLWRWQGPQNYHMLRIYLWRQGGGRWAALSRQSPTSGYTGGPCLRDGVCRCTDICITSNLP